MATLMAFLRMYENDVRITLPQAQEQLAARRSFSEAYGKKHAASMLALANDQHQANVRRMRAVLIGLATIKDKLETDPNYSARQADSDIAILRTEYNRLREELPRLALRVEDARAVDADPVTWAENHFQKFPALADRLPGLPAFA